MDVLVRMSEELRDYWVSDMECWGTNDADEFAELLRTATPATPATPSPCPRRRRSL